MMIAVIFAAVGLGLAIAGLRSRAVACDPVCATCGYDLRGYARLIRCSECGSDLTVSGAVRRQKAKASRRTIITGVCIIALPWLWLAKNALQNFAGPRWERLRSNHSLIMEINSDDYDDRPFLWDELARRLTIGSLSKAEASVAVDRAIASINRWHPVAPLFWADQFFTAAQTAGVISTPQYLALVHAAYGNAPRVDVGFIPASIPADQRGFFPVYANWLQGRDLPGLDRQAIIQQITIIPDGNADASKMVSTNLLTPDGSRMTAPSVPPGKYTLVFVVQLRLMPKLSPAAAPLASFCQTVTQPLQVTAAQYPVRQPTATTLPFPSTAPER